MKTLKHQTLVYDKDCPLCRAYTAGFVKTGMLDENGRLPYTELNTDTCTFVDADRARNEIALIDHQSKTVTYGIDSLLKVLGHSMPFIAKAGTTKPVHAFLKKLYSLVSYNRKVIIPSAKSNTEAQCIPNFNLKYRIAYMLFAGIMTALSLYRYSQLMNYGKAVVPFYIELVFALGQIPFQRLLLLKESRETQFEYFGNLITVSLFGSLLLGLGMVADTITSIPAEMHTAWFLITAAIMFFEHLRRVKLLQLPVQLCISWLGYRFILLGLTALYVFFT
jgi:predicted DCC family thiol-disulfide oxidoreductase YuxK